MIAIATAFNYEIPLAEQARMIRAAGFTHLALGANTEHSGYLTARGQDNVKEQLNASGLGICAVHAPCGRERDMSAPQADASVLDLFKRAVDAAVSLDAGVLVFHPTCTPDVDEVARRKESLVRCVLELLDQAPAQGLRLAVENMRLPESTEIAEHTLDAIDDERLGFCYDTSHANLSPGPMNVLKRRGGRLFTTHISDNRGERDDHLLPFEGQFPWEAFCDVFSEIDFSGPLLLEPVMKNSAVKDPEEFLRQACIRGRDLLTRSGKAGDARDRTG